MSRVLVKDIMSAPVVALLAEQSLPFADDIMQFKHLRHLPVIDGRNKLVGLVSHRDVLRAQVSSLDGIPDGERRFRENRVLVDAIMTRGVRTTRADAPAAEAGELLLANRFGCLPVVDDEGRLIGIVTASDFVRLAVDGL